MEEFQRPLGDQIKIAREKKNLSQAKLAEMIGKTDRTILNIENYHGNPKMEVLYPLVRTLTMDPTPIFYPEDEITEPNKAKLRVLLAKCNEEASCILIPIVESVINYLESKSKIDV